MSTHEFTATINTFNTAAWHYPPPNPFEGSAVFYTCFFITFILVGAIATIHRTEQQGFVLLVLPFLFLVCSSLIVYYRKRQRQRVKYCLKSIHGKLD
jgi:glycerol uptake facilitator-like aquaporin